MVYGLLFSAIVGLAHYISNRFYLAHSRHRRNIISFIAGLSLTYLLLVLLPDFYALDIIAESRLLLFFVLIGFAFFHLIDKFIYQKAEHRRVRKDIRIAHGIGIIFYYFVIGIVLFSLAGISTKQGILFFIPVVLYAVASNIYSVGVRGIRSREFFSLNLIQSIAPAGGALLAFFLPIPEKMVTAFVGIVAGMLTFIIVRDVIPKDEKGKPIYFILGMVLYALVIVIAWLA